MLYRHFLISRPFRPATQQPTSPPPPPASASSIQLQSSRNFLSQAISIFRFPLFFFRLPCPTHHITSHPGWWVFDFSCFFFSARWFGLVWFGLVWFCFVLFCLVRFKFKERKESKSRFFFLVVGCWLWGLRGTLDVVVGGGVVVWVFRYVGRGSRQGRRKREKRAKK